MTHIAVTQYMRPDGRAVEGSIEVPDLEIFRRAKMLESFGYRFMLEVLTTGDVSLAVEGPMPGDEDEECDIACVVFKNEPGAVFANFPRALEQAEAALRDPTPPAA